MWIMHQIFHITVHRKRTGLEDEDDYIVLRLVQSNLNNLDGTWEPSL